MVEPVHQTAIIHAMGDAEHVADFVDHCPEGGIQNELPIDLFGLLLCEGIIPSEKREYADSRLVLGPPIHEIPVFSWVDILQSDAHNTVGIFWHVALHILQDVLGEILFAIGVLSTSDVPKFRGEVEDRQAANSQSWVEYTAELYQLLQELVIELSELLEIDGLPLRGDFVVVRQSIVGKCLMHFLVMLQPISSLGLRHWLEQSLYLQEVSFVLLLLERTKSTCSLLLWYEHSQIIKRIINFNQSIICQRSSSMRHCRAIKGRISISSLRQT